MPNSSSSRTSGDPKDPAINPVLQDIAELNALVFGMSPAMSLATIYAANAHSTAILFENAVAEQALQSLIADMGVIEAASNLNAMRRPKKHEENTDLDPNDLQSLLDALRAVH